MKRTKNTPWQAIDLFTNDTLGWYETDTAAYVAHPTGAVSVLYRPLKRR